MSEPYTGARPIDDGATSPVGATTPPAAPAPTSASSRRSDAAGFTRAAALWTSVGVGFVVLIVLLIFIAQNTEPQQVDFLGWQWTLPLGVSILGAAVLGGLVTVLAGMVRIFQLRRVAKRNLKAGLKP